MRITRVSIDNFRGIKKAIIDFNGHGVLVGDNNTGKSTILEAIDLVLGPERLSRYPIIDEHDFYAGEYLKLNGQETENVHIKVEVIITDLNEEQYRRFANHIEFWDSNEQKLIVGPPVKAIDEDHIKKVLRITFDGSYDEEEDDFQGSTFFNSPANESGENDRFGKTNKRICGFLFLRTIRTGSRALSLEKGTLLDIILRIKDIRPKMWEDVLNQLRPLVVAEDPELKITDILESVQNSVREFVPSNWGENPHMKVSNLTRNHLRKILTVFMGTGSLKSDDTEYSAPYYHQGTGTINTLVLSLLSIIAKEKQNVIFAMEEPEIGIPPYTQKRVTRAVTSTSAQAIFTSHSPYVIEEFEPS